MIASPSVEAFAKSHILVITGRHPGPAGPVEHGYLGRPVERDAMGPLELEDALDVQVDPIPVQRGEQVGIMHDYKVKPVAGLPNAGVVCPFPVALVDLQCVPPGALKRLFLAYSMACEGHEALRRSALGIVR